MRGFTLLMVAPLAAALIGCTVGPNYAGPPASSLPAKATAFVRADLANSSAQPELAPWWTALNDPMLDSLIDQALGASPSLAASRARLAQARAALSLERANARPSSGLSALYLHGELPPLSAGADERSSLDLYNLGFDASWELDLFGGQHRRQEAAGAALEASRADLVDLQLSVSAKVAQAYVGLRDRQARLDLALRSSDLAERIQTLTGQRAAAGTTTALELEQARQSVELARQRIATIDAERKVYLDTLAILCARPPGALDTALASAKPVPTPPASVAVGDPESLLRRRPDVRAAERQLAEETAKIGVAEAARYPRLSFMGILGLGGGEVQDVLDPDKLSALALPRLQWSVFDFGRNAARVEQASAARDEAQAQFQIRVLAALADAEDALARFGASRQMLAAAERVALSNRRQAALARGRFDGGTGRLGEALDAERQDLAAQDQQIQAQSAVTEAFITVQKALGLGWRSQAQGSSHDQL